jgi:hypothetical protein
MRRILGSCLPRLSFFSNDSRAVASKLSASSATNEPIHRRSSPRYRSLVGPRRRTTRKAWSGDGRRLLFFGRLFRELLYW